MPTYEYECAKCKKDFEIFQSMKDDSLTVCPKDKCRMKTWGKGKVKRKLGVGAGFIFKGSGFYITDYRSEGYKKSSKDASSTSTESKKSDNHKADAPKAEPKPAAKPKARLISTMRAIAILLLSAGTALTMARADDNIPDMTIPGEVATTVTCDQYPQVSCTGANPAEVSDVIQLAVDTRDNQIAQDSNESLAFLLNLGPKWRYPVHITLIDPDPTGKTPAPHESVNALTDGTTLRIEASLSSDDPNAHEFVQRQFVNAMLWEKFFKPDQAFTGQTRIDVVPFWLLEGLREWLNEDPEHNREQVVKRAAIANRAPTLAEVTSWKDLTDDKLTGLWRRAFCFYLVDSLINKKDRLADFQAWLASITGANPQSPKWLFPTEMGWQGELLKAGDRSRAMVFTWEESAAEVAAAETITLPKGDHASDTQLCTIDTVATFPPSKALDEAVSAKVLELTALQLRAHASWQPIIELYRFGLTTLVRDRNTQRAIQYIHEARVRRAAEMAFHDKLIDYANWYEVTQFMPVENSHFASYFRTAKEIDKAEADPAHPNPVRADLLKVESEF